MRCVYNSAARNLNIDRVFWDWMEENLAIGISIIFLYQVPKSGIKMQHLHPQEKRKHRHIDTA